MKPFHRSSRHPAPDYGPLLAQKMPQAPNGGPAARGYDLGRARLLFGAVLFALSFAIIAGRLVDLSLTAPDGLALGRDPAGIRQVVASRADIVDRNGTLIATGLPTASLYADPARVLDPEECARALAEALPELGHEDLVGKLSGERRFIWLKRHLTPRQQYDINRLGLPGIGFVEDERRVYPQGPLFAHALGYTGIDNHGLAGLEHALDERLAAPERSERPEPLALSLDLRVQHALREELVRSVESFRALGAAGLVLDVDTGEILALVSLPDFDPNLPDAPTGEAMFNRATLGVYEMGSTFKIFTVAMALDSGSVTIDGGYDASQPIAVSGYVITDYHPQNRFLTVPEIMIHSSNIGAAKMALDLGAARQKEYLHRFGLLTATRIELPEVGLPLAPKTWRDINTMTIAFGHGVAVSPLQLANAAAAMVNGGVLRPATLIKRADEGPVPGVQVISAETSRYMRWLMRLVVEQGTGRNAEASGYFVGGKTGTAEKAIAGHYEKSALLSTFVGAFPMRKPRYVVLITLDEPKGTPETFGFATAGWTAAPTASRLITRLGPLLGIEPMVPLAPAANGSLVQHEEGRLELASF